MSRRHDRFGELCAAWVLGALEDVELHEFQQLWKDADPQMRTMHDELEHAALHLPASASPAEPAPQVKSELLEKIRSAGKHREDWRSKLTRTRPARFVLSAALALLVLSIGLAVVSGILYRQVNQQAQRLQALSDELERRGQLLEILESKEVEVVLLEGMDRSPTAYGRIFWDTAADVAVLQVSNLPPAPDDRIYQLWIFPAKGDPESAGIFALDQAGPHAFFRLEAVTQLPRESVWGWMVTMESKGGAAGPSGEERYLGGRTSSAPHK